MTSATVLKQLIEEETGPFYWDIVLMREVEGALRLPHLAGMIGPVESGKVVAAMKQIGARKVGVAHDGGHRQIRISNGPPVRLWAVRNVAKYLNAPDDVLKAEVLRVPPDQSNVQPMKSAADKEEAGEAKAG